MLSLLLAWLCKLLTTWFAAAIGAGVLIVVLDRFSGAGEPSGADVRQAVERYRRHYGPHASAALSDHIVAASFAQDGRHRRFLKRVRAELDADLG